MLLDDREPSDALRCWVARLARYAVTKHGLADALRVATSPGNDLSSTDTYERSSPPSTAAQANISAGTLRAGLDANDVILAWPACGSSTPRATERSSRAHYDIVLSGCAAAEAAPSRRDQDHHDAVMTSHPKLGDPRR